MTENPANYEVNLLLPVAFGIVAIIFFSGVGFLFWLLKKSGIVGFINNHYLLSLLRDVFLSFAGVVIFSVILGVVIFIVQVVGDLLSK